jgi:hypothetical protein
MRQENSSAIGYNTIAAAILSMALALGLNLQHKMCYTVPCYAT